MLCAKGPDCQEKKKQKKQQNSFGLFCASMGLVRPGGKGVQSQDSAEGLLIREGSLGKDGRERRGEAVFWDPVFQLVITDDELGTGQRELE